MSGIGTRRAVISVVVRGMITNQRFPLPNQNSLQM